MTIKYLPAIFLTLLITSARAQKAPVVLLDRYFNNEWKKPSTGGDSVRFHYTWEDKENSGFSSLGDIFRQQGFSLSSLDGAPTKEELSKAAVYIIVDPDIEKENPHPHFISPRDVQVIRDWVSGGGVLVLMGNDKGNAEFEHLNTLSEVFGIHFNEDCVNHVVGEQRDPGTIHIPAGDPIFKTALILYMKDVASFRLSGTAKPAIINNGFTIAATATSGLGTVFAIGDPWIYNEYIDNHILPASFQNLEGARVWVSWLKEKVKNR